MSSVAESAAEAGGPRTYPQKRGWCGAAFPDNTATCRHHFTRGWVSE